MTLEYTVARVETAVVDSPAGSIATATPARGWTSRVLLGGMIAAGLIGWAQDAFRVAGLRAEPGQAAVVVITKEQARLRIHPRRVTAGPTAGPTAISHAP